MKGIGILGGIPRIPNHRDLNHQAKPFRNPLGLKPETQVDSGFFDARISIRCLEKVR